MVLLNSCSNATINGGCSEVNFENEKEIYIEYNFESLNGLLSFNNGVLVFKYLDNCGVMSGAEVIINKNTYKFTDGELVFEDNTNTLPDKFLPKLLFDWITSNNGRISAEMYDDVKLCFYLDDSCSSFFIRFEVYESNGNIAYALIIT